MFILFPLRNLENKNSENAIFYFFDGNKGEREFK